MSPSPFSGIWPGVGDGLGTTLQMCWPVLMGSAVAVAAVAAVAGFAIVVVAIHDRLQAGKLLAFAQVDERHALRRAPHLSYFLHARADEHAARGDEHDLVVGRDQGRGDHLAVSLRGLARDHALRAAAVARVFRDQRALAVAVLGRREHALRLVLRPPPRA